MFVTVDADQKVGKHPALVYPSPDLSHLAGGNLFKLVFCYFPTHSFSISPKLDSWRGSSVG